MNNFFDVNKELLVEIKKREIDDTKEIANDVIVTKNKSITAKCTCEGVNRMLQHSP